MAQSHLTSIKKLYLLLGPSYAVNLQDEKTEKFAKLWRKLAKENGLHQKTRLFRELVAMLLGNPPRK